MKINEEDLNKPRDVRHLRKSFDHPKPDYKKQGKKNRAAGQRFELKVRDSKGRFTKGHKVLGEGIKKVIEYNRLNGVWNKNKKLRNRTKVEKQKTSDTMKKRWTEKRPLTSQQRKDKISNTLKGHVVCNETKKKIRKAISIHVKKVGGPRLGKYEKQILDEIAKEIGYKIIRQYFVKGFFVDGYCREKSRVYEIDEKPKNSQREIERENTIKKELNCTFVRIPTW